MDVEAIGKIKAAVSMRDIIGRYGGDEPNSKGFICCPFHGEKTASFKIYDNNNTYYCFGCGVHGDVIDYIKEIFKCGVTEAIKRIDADFDLGLFKIKSLKEQHEDRKKYFDYLKQKKIEADRKEYSRIAYNELCKYYRWLCEQTSSEEVSFQKKHLDKLLDAHLSMDKLIDFDYRARIQGFASALLKEGKIYEIE